MNNADRRNIHARTTCPDAGMDRQVLSTDEDDGIGMSRILRRARLPIHREGPASGPYVTQPSGAAP